MTGSKPKNTISRYGLHKKIGISKQAVYQAVAAGRLRMDDDGKIDLDDELTIQFLRFHEGAAPASGENGRGRPIENGNGPPVDFSADASRILKSQESEHHQFIDSGKDGEPLTIAAQEKQLDIRLKKIKEAKEQALYHALIKKVVPFEVAARLFNMINAAVDQGFRNFDQDHTEEIVDAVKDGKSVSEVQALIRGHVEDRLRTVKETTHIAIDQLGDIDR